MATFIIFWVFYLRYNHLSKALLPSQTNPLSALRIRFKMNACCFFLTLSFPHPSNEITEFTSSIYKQYCWLISEIWKVWAHSFPIKMKEGKPPLLPPEPISLGLRWQWWAHPPVSDHLQELNKPPEKTTWPIMLGTSDSQEVNEKQTDLIVFWDSNQLWTMEPCI